MKWARRHPSLAALGAVVATAAVSIIVVLALAYDEVRAAVEEKRREAEVARKARADEEEQRKRAEQLATDNEAKRNDAARQNEELKRQIEERRRAAFALQLAQVAAMCDRDPRRALALLEDEARCPPDLRDFTWAYLRRLCQREDTVYAEHQPDDPVHAVAYSPTGGLVATAGAGGLVRVWDPRDGRTWAVLAGHDGPVRGVAFSPDGGAVATAGEDGAVRLWELPVGMLEDARRSVAFFPVIRPWVKPLTIRPAVTLPDAHDRARVNCLAFSPNGRTLVTGGDDGRLRWWNVNGWRATTPDAAAAGGPGAAAAAVQAARSSASPVWLLRQPVDAHYLGAGARREMRPVRSVAFSASGNAFASGGADHAARVWEPTGASLVRTFAGHADAVAAVALSPDGKTLAAANNHAATPTVRLIDTDSRRDLRRLTGHTRAVYALAFSGDGELVASAGLDKSVRVWDTDGRERALLLGHELAVSGVAFAPDRRTLVSAGMDGTARVWHTSARTHDAGQVGADATLAAAAVSAGRGPGDAAAGPTTFVTGDDRGQVRFYRADLFPGRGRGNPLTLQPAPNISITGGQVRAAATTPDGTVVLASTNNGISLWRLRPGGRPGLPPMVTRPVRVQVPKPTYAMAADPTGRWLATLDQEGVRVWNLAALADQTDRAAEPQGPGLVLRVPDAREVAFHPSGDRLAVAVGNGVRVIDRTGKVLAALPAAHDAAVEALAFGGDDGRLLATADANGLVKVWRVGPAGGLTHQSDLTGHTAAVYALAFSPDGRTLASGGHDRTILLSDPLSGQERAILTGHADRVLRLTFLPDASALVSVARDGGVKRWRADRGAAAPPPVGG